MHYLTFCLHTLVKLYPVIQCQAFNVTWKKQSQYQSILCKGLIFVLHKYCGYSNQSTAWTGFYWFSISIHDTVWMLISSTHLHFITCTNVQIHSFNVHFKGFCVNSNSLNFLLFVMNNRNGSTYIAQFISTFSALILAGD